MNQEDLKARIKKNVIAELRNHNKNVSFADCIKAFDAQWLLVEDYTQNENDLALYLSKKCTEIITKSNPQLLAKLENRPASEGMIGVRRNEEGDSVAVVFLAAETDFVAKTDLFLLTLALITDVALENQVFDKEELLATLIDENDILPDLNGKTVQEAVHALALSIKENIHISDYHYMEDDFINFYAHRLVDMSSEVKGVLKDWEGSLCQLVSSVGCRLDENIENYEEVSEELIEDLDKCNHILYVCRTIARHALIDEDMVYLSVEYLEQQNPEYYEAELKKIEDSLASQKKPSSPEIEQKILSGKKKAWLSSICVSESVMEDYSTGNVAQYLKAETKADLILSNWCLMGVGRMSLKQELEGLEELEELE